MRIREVTTSPEGFWTARLKVGDDQITVDRRFGSWGTVPDERGHWRCLKPHIAEALQDHVRRMERRH